MLLKNLKIKLCKNKQPILKNMHEVIYRAFYEYHVQLSDKLR